jgi:hypothetical protein
VHRLLSELLRFAELEYTVFRASAPRELKEMVVPCRGERPADYYAVDSGYVVRRVGEVDVLVQSLVAVGRDVRRKFVVQRVGAKPHETARLNEIAFAESIDAGIILVDGPLTPYVSKTRVVGVSKDPRLGRYGPRIPDAARRGAFTKVSRALGERRAAALLLADAPPGSYLEPVDLGHLHGTYIKSDFVLYVELPKSMPVDRVCSLLARYPVRLRLAHYLARISRNYLKTLRYVMSRLLREELPPGPIL